MSRIYKSFKIDSINNIFSVHFIFDQLMKQSCLIEKIAKEICKASFRQHRGFRSTNMLGKKCTTKVHFLGRCNTWATFSRPWKREMKYSWTSWSDFLADVQSAKQTWDGISSIYSCIIIEQIVACYYYDIAL